MRPEGTRKKPESARINAQRIRKCPAGVPLQGRGRGFGAGGRKNCGRGIESWVGMGLSIRGGERDGQNRGND